MAVVKGDMFVQDGIMTVAIPPSGKEGTVTFEVLRIHPAGPNFPAWADMLVDGKACRINPEICQPPFHRLADCAMIAHRDREKMPFEHQWGSKNEAICIQVSLPNPTDPQAQEYVFWRSTLKAESGEKLEVVMIDTKARLKKFGRRNAAAPQVVPIFTYNEGELAPDAPRIDFNAKELYQMAAREFSQGTFVEVGAWVGRSTAYLASLIAPGVKLWVVDTWQGSFGQDPRSEEHYKALLEKHNGDVFRVFLDNMEKWGFLYRITPLRMLSILAARLFPNSSIDFCYIDAGHDYVSVKEDLHAWYPKVRSGGVISGDDYGVDWPGVDQAVNEFFAPIANVKTLGQRSWYLRKP
jgi:predicted O-methyltransferase YrrM